MSGNVIDLCEARKKKFPTKEEIVSHLAEMIEVSDYFEKDVAASLLELFESDMLAKIGIKTRNIGIDQFNCIFPIKLLITKNKIINNVG